MKAWHFCRNDRKLAYNDGRVIRTGRTYKVYRPQDIEMCEYGLHGSLKIIDALKYASGDILCRVELAGYTKKDDDKIVASERTVLWQMDCSRILHEFACKCAERGLKRAKVKDERCWNALKVKRQWIQGKATNSMLDAAWDAAWDAELKWQNKTLMKMIREERT